MSGTTPETKAAEIVVDANTDHSNNAADHSEAVTAGGGDDENSVVYRNPTERPIFKLSVNLIDTYKYINKVYYEAKAKRLLEQKDSARGGVHNDGYDDQNYDYILQGDEIVNDRYILKHKMGKGSFGQVVCAYDRENKCEVAIKIIKSRKPFLVQARTEIEILSKILEKDDNDESNIVRLLDQFIYRNHQCLVFELLSFNLYELLKNTKFRGVSLTLIRKFSKNLLKSLEFLSRPDVNIIHCDLKPENILLRHPRRSAIKMIDFGSSCYLTKRTYTYIQSRFYRSPEVLLGLPYSQKIDMWSLGCVVVEMHTGEPLFGGTNQLDQMGRIIDVMGMPPLEMILQSPEKTRAKFFEKWDAKNGADPPVGCDLGCKVEDDDGNFYVFKRAEPSKKRNLVDILGVNIGGPHGRRAEEKVDHTVAHYEEFLDFVMKLLVYLPEKRATPTEVLAHSYLTVLENQEGALPAASAATAAAKIESAAAAAATTAAATAVTTAAATATVPPLTASQEMQTTAIDMMAKVSLQESSGDGVSGNGVDGATNSKDTVRGRRTDVSSSSKRRSQSAPGGISF